MVTQVAGDYTTLQRVTFGIGDGLGPRVLAALRAAAGIFKP
jgi:hypothetical protein